MVPATTLDVACRSCNIHFIESLVGSTIYQEVPLIAERSSGVVVGGNMTGQSFQAGIDDENMPWVISLFTDLYSDPIAAVVREYATNAHDAQVENGYSGPIEVTLPTALAPFYKIKDRGVGLSAEDIQRIYSRYGSSTKRGTNDQNGMLGMGCKSALAYSEQFTVESVKDGMRTVCSISREEGGVPIFTVVASVPDDGENGTEVIVPVQRHHHSEFSTKAATFFSYWPEDSVLVNGQAPERVTGLDLGDGILLCKKDGYSYGRNPNVVVMGNVAYPVEDGRIAVELPTNYWLVVTVPIGSVEFVPSREALNYNKITKPTLDALGPKVKGAIDKAVQAEIDGAATHRDAVRIALQWNDLRGGHYANVAGLKFKGQAMPPTIDGEWVMVPWRGHKQTAHERRDKGVAIENIVNSLVVEGFDNLGFTVTMKKKLLQYVEDNGIEQPAYFALCDKRPVSEWIADAQVVQWADIKAVKLAANQSTYGWWPGRPTGSYDAYIGGGASQHVQADEIDQNEPIYYCRSMNKWEAREYAALIGQFFPAATVVCLPENRYAKFARNFPTAKSYRDGLQAAYDLWASKLTRGERLALAIYDGSEWDTFKRIDPARVDDPAIKKAARVAGNVDVQKLLEARRTFRHVQHQINTAQVGANDWTCPLARYELTKHMTYGSPETSDHYYIYLNAAFPVLEAAAAEASQEV